MALNPKRRKLARLYFRTGDSYKSYRLAGYKAKTRDAALKGASEILNLPEVKEYIAQLHARADEKALAEMQQEWQQTREVRRDIAYSDVDDLFEFDATTGLPKHKPGDAIPKRVKRAIRSVEVEVDPATGNTRKVKYQLAPKEPHLAALEDKFSILPDTQKAPQQVQVDVTSGGKPIPTTVDGRRDAVLALLAVWRERLAAPPADSGLNLIQPPIASRPIEGGGEVV